MRGNPPLISYLSQTNLLDPMSLNKDAYTRYRVINRVLVVRKRATLKELQQACEDVLGMPVSDRTIKRDIEDMRKDTRLDWKAPIRYDRGDGKYYYGVKGFSIDLLPLNEEELDALLFASSMLDQFRKVEILENIEGAVQKIAGHLRMRKTIDTSEVSDFIDFEKMPEMKGSEFLGPLLNAILKKKVLKLTYQGFDRPQPSSHIFHPYLLKEYRNRWYAFGYAEDSDDLRTYALDRIKSITPEPRKDFRKPEKPPKEYFRDVIGVTRFEDTEPWKVVLKFSKHQAPYILTQPMHESQEVVQKTDDYTIISLIVHPSPELEIILLGWHSEVEVLEPTQLREQIRLMHLKAAAQPPPQPSPSKGREL
jgi:predicted DNA-binding transcriptional regulator YafY